METKPWPECSIIKRSPVIFSSISLEITTNIKAWRISKPNIFKFSILSFRFVETMEKKTTPQIGINVRQLKATLPWPLKFIVQKLQESYNKYSWESWRYASIRPRLNTRLDEKEGHRSCFFLSFESKTRGWKRGDDFLFEMQRNHKYNRSNNINDPMYSNNWISFA